MKPPKDLLRRNLALQETHARFKGRPLALGQADCIKAGRFHLVKMGHKGLPKTGAYSTPLGAARALKRQGVETIEQLMDKFLPRIAPAAMLPGDLALVEAAPGEESIGGGSLVISLGRKWLGWPEIGEGFAVLEPIVDRPFKAAWRA